MDAPAPISDFYSRIKNIEFDSLLQHPEFIDLREDWFKDRASKFKLQLSVVRSNDLASKYIAIQLACFDFLGKCAWCSEPSRHGHGAQNCNVYEIEHFPGLYLYPELFANRLVLKELLDQLFHQELASPSSSTNFHEAYHVTYPRHPSAAGQRLSFFDQANSQLRMQPRLAESSQRVPLTIIDFLEQLLWIKVPLPENIKTLMESMIPLEVNYGTAFVSTPTRTLGLGQDQAKAGFFLDVSLGCDGIMVIGKERELNDEQESHVSKPSLEPPEDSWHKWIVGLDDENEKDDEKEDQAAGVHFRDFDESDCKSIENESFDLAAIRLRHGDAVVFENFNAWHGIAQVVEGTLPTWELNWPCWSEAPHSASFPEWRGCMKGHRVDFVLH